MLNDYARPIFRAAGTLGTEAALAARAAVRFTAANGDVLFAGSVGRTDLPGGSHATLINSIKEKLLPLGDDVGFICGHGAGSSIGQERMTNPFITGEM